MPGSSAATPPRSARSPRGLDLDRATDILWVFNDPALYDVLVAGRGWPEADFTGWLSSQIRHALLPPGG